MSKDYELARLTEEGRKEFERMKEMKAAGRTDSEIAKDVGLLTTEVRAIFVADREETRQKQIQKAKEMQQTGSSTDEIAQALGIPENNVRALLKPKTLAEISQIIQARDLSVSDAFRIEGPWGVSSLAGFEFPIHIFQDGTNQKVKVGTATAVIDNGLKFEIELKDEYKNLDVTARFEVPMKFTVKNKHK